MSQQFTIRRLEVGETANPETDWYLSNIDRNELLPVDHTAAIDRGHRPHYRISLKEPEQPGPTKPLQIEAGKFYRNRKGEKISVKAYCGTEIYRWSVNEIPQYLLTADGKVVPECEHPKDLIAPWDEPEQPEAESRDAIKFNVNDCVRVKLTDAGRRIVADYKVQFFKQHGTFLEHMAAEDSQGWSKWQMHDLMGMFGEHCAVGCDLPFETDIELLPLRRATTPQTAPPEPQAEQVPSVDLQEHELSELRKANAELLERCNSYEQLKEMYGKALDCVDQVFQQCTKYPQPILPDYCLAGHSKFGAVVRLAKDYADLKRANAELLERNARLEQQISDAAEVISCRGEKLINIYDALGVCSIKEALPKAMSVHALTAERDKLAERCRELEAQLAALQAKPEQVQYAWRDARPEDAGSKWEARGRDGEFSEWRYGDRRITAYVPTDEYPWKTSIYGASAFSWKQCQVYAPVEAPAPQDEWRELTPGEKYSGPGQVRDYDEMGWSDAVIVATDNIDSLPFVAKKIGSRYYGACKFARVRVKRGAE